MGDNIAKADEFKKQGEKKLKAFGFFGNKYEDAMEFFEKAANHYKLAKCWNDAAECYTKLAECHLKCDSKHEAASAYVDAAKVLAKSQPQSSTELLHKAVSLYTEMGRLNMAARQLKEIAENNEKQGLKEEAITFYDQAADLFETEGSSSEATKCKLKIAEFSAELGKYSKAVDIFEEAAKRAVENNLLKFSARGYLLNAGICVMCYASLDTIEQKIEKYRDIDLQFSGSREDTLLSGLLEAFQKVDDAMFSTHLAEFDSVIRLDAWKTKILLQAKRRLQDMEIGVGGDDDDDEEVL
uniref:Alpha-soluble NSF attachment protein n=1 Tax=Chlamydomonas leiostraca TaxID=1034604 RepID=A0A7S0WRH7_9CHLO|mmetsp:Transcript_2507/g.6445  ORF Transcript_2507/g.6445 Transcript_2507/m.6445 type:complete len:297 (+) Transcript_2507:23-913(+)|eukprot:CAMPEP_0202859450 /NCGR_PEP_ID=MMETSP1391-20130828/1556_1 /ASSEMBLY_ACC=CAM_ASM_000867 /TAXON_ID=1034604 /ORGANISM="Chlamydomonas leiostraca, Strain SAG 11-49" /LENGTH=296 /DNA_ID=CAMNT_0049538483 /DNA_START=24 /DNA_END=914 /DNA_ORIENTATION=-